MKAVLALEDGTWFQGTAVGAEGTASGEVVFNTGLTGYQEILTDPSYAGQIVTMTCPEIGNYGVAAADVESRAPQVAGFVMRSESLVASNWRAAGPLGDYLAASGIVAIAGIDTRALTRRLRSAGVMRGVIGTGDRDPSALVEAARRAPRMAGSDLVSGVTCAAPFDWPLGGRAGGQRRLRARDQSRALPPVPRGGVGLRHEVEHPAAALRLRLRRPGLSRVHAGGGAARGPSGGRLPQQRARRSGGPPGTSSTTCAPSSPTARRCSASAWAIRCSGWRSGHGRSS